MRIRNPAAIDRAGAVTDSKRRPTEGPRRTLPRTDAMADIKTKPTAVPVEAYIAAIEKPVRRADAATLRDMMERITGERATMWGPSMIGFGTYHYRYDSGHEADMCRIAFAPRSANLVLYLGGYPEFPAMADRLGKVKRSKACLYVNKLADIDLRLLEEIIQRSYDASGDVAGGRGC